MTWPDALGKLSGPIRPPVQMDDERERRVGWNFARPAYDELLGVRIQIPLPKGCRIDRVEQLLQLCEVNLDQAAVRWYRIAAD